MPREHSSHVYAVITGDIVGSTKLRPTEMKNVRTSVCDTVEQFNAFNFYLNYREHPQDVKLIQFPKKVEFSQGDTWQAVLVNPSMSLRLALMIQAHLRYQVGAETRMAIGIGVVDAFEKTTGTSTGEAFTLSGRALESMSSAFRLTGGLPRRTEVLSEWFPGILHLCSALMRGWTKRQAEVMSHWLTWPSPDPAEATYEWVADKLHITKQSVGDILSSAQLPPLRDALARFQKTDWQLLVRPQTALESAGDDHALATKKRHLRKNTRK